MSIAELSAGRVHYEETGPADGRPVVCVHGYGMGGSLWHPLAARLAERGFRCLTPTWPLGAQPEAMSAAADLTMEGIAALVGEFLDALDLEDVVLIGNDTGGAIAQLVAVDHGGRLGALALTSCDALEHFPPPILKPLITAARMPAPTFSAALMPLRTKLGRGRAYGALAHSDLDALVQSWVRPALTDRAVRENLRTFTASLSAETTLRAAERLPAVELPTLIAWSADDAFFPLGDGERLAALIPGARLELIEDARTFSMLDQTERLAELVGEFAVSKAAS